MALCCDFLAWRLALAKEMKPHCSLERRRTELLRHHNAAWLNIWSGISAYYYALLGESEKIPPIFGEHRLSDINMLAPGRQMLIENQVYLAQENYAKVIGRSDGQLSVCEGMHYRLVALHIRIQTAAAYEAHGKMAGGGADAEAGHSGGGDGLSDASVCGELSLFEKTFTALSETGKPVCQVSDTDG